MIEMKEKIFCSVILPSYNSEETIVQSLRSIRNMQTGHNYEVIVVDSSSDATPEVIRHEFPEVTLIHLEEQTYPGSARNLGLQHARGNVVAFVDSDCIVAPDWLNRMVEAHLKYDYAAIVGGIGNGTPKNLVGWTGYLIEFNEWTPKTKPRIIGNILGGNVSYKKERIQKHNLSYTDVFPSEDTIFAWDLCSKGETIFFDPSIVVYHLNRTDFKVLLRHQYVLGSASAQARRTTGLYGKIFSRHPVLCLGLPVVRFMRAAFRLIGQDFGYFFMFLLISPMYFLCTMFWSLGFLSKRNFGDTKIEYDVQKDKEVHV
jgi:glycosyltransferase involved in cell wall biosynthesis